MNVELKNRIKAHILEEPKRLDIHNWFTSLRHVRPEQRPSCGTIGCFAGWAHILAGGSKHDVVNVFSFARELQIDYSLADKACFLNSWPKKFLVMWNAAKSAKQRARVAGMVLDALESPQLWERREQT